MENHIFSDPIPFIEWDTDEQYEYNHHRDINNDDDNNSDHNNHPNGYGHHPVWKVYVYRRQQQPSSQGEERDQHAGHDSPMTTPTVHVGILYINDVTLPPRRRKDHKTGKQKIVWRLPTNNHGPLPNIHNHLEQERLWELYKRMRKNEKKKQLQQKKQQQEEQVPPKQQERPSTNDRKNDDGLHTTRNEGDVSMRGLHNVAIVASPNDDDDDDSKTVPSTNNDDNNNNNNNHQHKNSDNNNNIKNNKKKKKRNNKKQTTMNRTTSSHQDHDNVNQNNDDTGGPVVAHSSYVIAPSAFALSPPPGFAAVAATHPTAAAALLPPPLTHDSSAVTYDVSRPPPPAILRPPPGLSHPAAEADVPKREFEPDGGQGKDRNSDIGSTGIIRSNYYRIDRKSSSYDTKEYITLVGIQVVQSFVRNIVQNHASPTPSLASTVATNDVEEKNDDDMIPLRKLEDWLSYYYRHNNIDDDKASAAASSSSTLLIGSATASCLNDRERYIQWQSLLMGKDAMASSSSVSPSSDVAGTTATATVLPRTTTDHLPYSYWELHGYTIQPIHSNIKLRYRNGNSMPIHHNGVKNNNNSTERRYHHDIYDSILIILNGKTYQQQQRWFYYTLSLIAAPINDDDNDDNNSNESIRYVIVNDVLTFHAM